MNTRGKLVLGLIATGVGLSAAFFGYAADWHYWPLPLTAAAGIDLITVLWPGRTAAMSADDAYVPHSIGPDREDPVRGIRLYSLNPDCDFLFSAIVRWRPITSAEVRREPTNANPGALAVAAIIERAREVALRESPELHTEAQNRLATALGQSLPDSSQRVEAWATSISLTVPAEDLERVRQLAELRKEAELWARQREFERQRRSYFAEDVFKSTGSAVVWMLAQKGHSEQDIHRTVEMIGPLARLSAAANETEVSDLYRDLVLPPGAAESESEEPTYVYPGTGMISESNGAEAYGEPQPSGPEIGSLAEHVAGVIQDFVEDAHTEQGTAFGKRMARVFDGLDLPETAQRIRADFGLRGPGPSDQQPGASMDVEAQGQVKTFAHENGSANNRPMRNVDDHRSSASEPTRAADLDLMKSKVEDLSASHSPETELPSDFGIWDDEQDDAL
jgi:hypothetical protein